MKSGSNYLSLGPVLKNAFRTFKINGFINGNSFLEKSASKHEYESSINNFELKLVKYIFWKIRSKYKPNG